MGEQNAILIIVCEFLMVHFLSFSLLLSSLHSLWPEMQLFFQWNEYNVIG